MFSSLPAGVLSGYEHDLLRPPESRTKGWQLASAQTLLPFSWVAGPLFAISVHRFCWVCDFIFPLSYYIMKRTEPCTASQIGNSRYHKAHRNG